MPSLCCGGELSLKEVYSYTGDRIVVLEPIEPLLTIDCEGL
ncbi:MAG: hypothetical protein ABI882_23230 [Acidobacteriota bacterium]